MRVLHVHTTLTGSGGDRVSESEVAYLERTGHAVAMVGRASDAMRAHLAGRGTRLIDPGEGDDAARAARVAAHGPVDVVHGHCMWSAPLALDVARRLGAGLVLHNHNMGDRWERAGRGLLRRQSGLDRRIRDAMEAADLTVCVSDPVVAHMRGLGIRARRVVTLVNPVAEGFLGPLDDAPPRHDIALVARMSRQKDPLAALDVLARAARRRPGLTAAWVGRIGHWRHVVAGYSALRRTGFVEFLGFRPQAEVGAILDRSRVLLSCSRFEGYPLNVVEALARGCAAVISDIPAHRFAFDGVENVHFFDRADPAAAAETLLAALAGFRRARPERFVATHTEEAHGRRLVELYGLALEARPRQRAA